MTPEELHDRLERGESVTLLDVRNREEYDAWHIDGDSVTTTLVPYSKFMTAEVQGTVEETARKAGLDPDELVVAVCGRGEASDYVAELLRDVGYNAENLEDGMRGWAHVYVSETVPTDADATVFQYRRPSSGCLAYMLVSSGEAAVIDPLRQFVDRYAADAREYGADIVSVIDTHVHADHVSGVRELADAVDATPVYPAAAEARGLVADSATKLVSDGDEIHVGDVTLTAVHTPGHTSEMTAFQIDDSCFSGDGLFLDSVARPDLEHGDEGAEDAARRLYETFQSVYGTFDDDVRVAPAHCGEATERAVDGTYTARLGTLRDRLPALSMDEAEFVEYVLDDMPPRPANYEEIIEMNLGRSEVEDDEAFELELGPNNCAVSQAD
ncbi:zn-dependent hydrolase, glyoxylase [Halogeometricum borinquense DSM 11551]|uniref:Zn-dependent hydrolase, glyoxylase n=1 Tax=Halogeometricum borinquense (strain ATCC 700274 / DSM 11551 / JCM 10706 / KCTC 4070 / PR3) TaxID=469382 RepID=E4NMA9_HALBP|nr:MBL fold metallo-hydrolase [Halogeometricum borinquense]ADQ67314.1 Zn-dependent hydrolase, glyoxylase [Halogeometricum borinquense DSM 11551]ELY28529.1 zn-dependent hydrolase, glyoxylase [Halogeometricum borinquense DSM 11551]